MMSPEASAAIRNYPLSIKDETIATAHGIPIAKVRKIRADLFKMEAKRMVAHRKKNASLDAIAPGRDDTERMMVNGSKKLLAAIRSTEFYQRH